MATYNKFLAEHLKFWEDSGIPAPANELQSIQSWLSYLARNGAEETMKTMRSRMVLLMGAANDLHEAGPEAEDEVGIYDNRPDLDTREK